MVRETVAIETLARAATVRISGLLGTVVRLPFRLTETCYFVLFKCKSMNTWTMAGLPRLAESNRPDPSSRIKRVTEYAQLCRTLMNGAATLLLLVSTTSFVWGQSISAGQEDSSATIVSTSTLVVVPATVRDASGEPFTKLQARDFRLTDNGVEQKAVAESVPGEPVALVVIVQTGGSAPVQFQNYRTLNAIVSSLTEHNAHRVGLVTFDSRLEEIWSFPPRVDGLKDAFRNPEKGDHGAAILDAVNCGIGLLDHQPASFRRVILLLSQAADDVSKTAPAEVLRRLGESNTTIYSIVFPPEKPAKHSSARDRNRRRSAPSPDLSLDAVLAAMQTKTAATVATVSGGESVGLKSKDDLDRTLSILANDFANSYTLSFRPASAEPGLHWIGIQLAKEHSHATIEARRLYWNGQDGSTE